MSLYFYTVINYNFDSGVSASVSLANASLTIQMTKSSTFFIFIVYWFIPFANLLLSNRYVFSVKVYDFDKEFEGVMSTIAGWILINATTTSVAEQMRRFRLFLEDLSGFFIFTKRPFSFYKSVILNWVRGIKVRTCPKKDAERFVTDLFIYFANVQYLFPFFLLLYCHYCKYVFVE